MEREIIITDLTRFKKTDEICMAGIDPETGECLRPVPYFKYSTFKKKAVLPGTILRGELNRKLGRTRPHIEDNSRSGKFKIVGSCTSAEFREVLEASRFDSVAEGFGMSAITDSRVIPRAHKAPRSIITIRVPPSEVRIVDDQFNPGRIKIHFRDGSGLRFAFTPITDLGFYDYAAGHRAAEDLETVNDFIQAQEEVYLRLGLSRAYKAPDGRDGYWIQANGIYTFPDFNREIRSYGP